MIKNVKLVDHEGKTVCGFVKSEVPTGDDGVRVAGSEVVSRPPPAIPGAAKGATEAWRIQGKPPSRKGERQSQARLARDNFDVMPPHAAPAPYISPDRHRWVLTLPGLVLRWERVTPVLDKLAAAGIDTLTIDGLRDAVGLNG